MRKFIYFILAMNLLLPSFAHASGTFSRRLGCSPEVVDVARTAVATVKDRLELGLATELDLEVVEIHLADMRYCAGDSEYPLSAYCDPDRTDSKLNRLDKILEMRKKSVYEGTLDGYVFADTKQEIKRFKKFCLEHKGRP